MAREGSASERTAVYLPSLWDRLSDDLPELSDQIDAIRGQLAHLPHRPTVIIGDFNEWSRKRGLGRLTREFRIATPGATFPARRPLAALDRVAHSEDLDVDVKPVRGLPGAAPSDHLPILATLRPRS